MDRLYPALTAKERAILILQSRKQGGAEPPLVRQTVPPEQAAEFSRHVGLLSTVSRQFPLCIMYLQGLFEKSFAQRGWLMCLLAWGSQFAKLSEYVCFRTKEAITGSEHHRLVQAARAKTAPTSHWAEVLLNRYDGWTAQDLDPKEWGDYDPPVSDRAWNRVFHEKEQEIRRLVEQGVLEAKRKGRRLMITAGSFYDWLGEPVRLLPDWGYEYEVLPDEESEKVEIRRMERQGIREIFMEGPSNPGVRALLRLMFEQDTGLLDETRTSVDKIMDDLSTSLREGIQECWRVLRAVEIVLSQVSAEFDGEEPLLPQFRDALNAIRAGLVEMHSTLHPIVPAFDLDEPDDHLVVELRRTITHAPVSGPSMLRLDSL